MAKRPRVPNYKVQAQVRKQKAISNLIEMYDTLEPREVVKAFNKCEGKSNENITISKFCSKCQRTGILSSKHLSLPSTFLCLLYSFQLD